MPISLPNDCTKPVAAKADVVILAGYDPIEMRVGWQNPWGEEASGIEFLAVPNTRYMLQAQYSFVCHTGEGLKVLRQGVTARPYWEKKEPGTTKRALERAFPTNDEWGPAAIIDTVHNAVPPSTVATADTGTHRILLSQKWHFSGPRTLLQSSALCTMGCALPLAMGHAIANGGKPVVAFTGDAGLEMVLCELATLRDPKILFSDSILFYL